MIALSFDGKVFSWGRNECGGLGSGIKKRLFPGQMDLSRVLQKEDYPVFVATGKRHGAMLTQHGEVFTWGGEIFGSWPGTSTSGAFLRAVFNEGAKNKPTGKPGEIVVSLACGSRQCYAITAEGRAYAWGRSCCVDSSGNIRSIMRHPHIIPDRSLPRRYRYMEREGRVPCRKVQAAWNSSLSVAHGRTQ